MAATRKQVCPIEAQQRGQELYRQHNYKAAMEAFNEAIGEQRCPSVSALDNRAATYTKLGDLQAALRDGKEMIHAAKTDVTGYLRTGKILQLLGKDDVALGIYKYGLRNVRSDDPNTELLRRMYDKLGKRCSPPKAADPLRVLPMELAEMVFKHLNFKNIMSLTGVSLHWYNFLTSTSDLWGHLDFSGASRPVPLMSVQACIRRSKGKITRAILNKHVLLHGDALRHITKHCKRLHYLEIQSGLPIRSLVAAAIVAPNLSSLVVSVECETTLDAVQLLLANCRNLERAEFHSIFSNGVLATWAGDMSKLRCLTMNAGTTQTFGFTTLRLDNLFRQLPQIRELTLRGWKAHSAWTRPDFSVLTDLRKLDLAGFQLPVFPSLPFSLQHLNLSNCYNIAFAAPESQMSLLDVSLSNLTSLSLSSMSKMSAEVLGALLEPSKGQVLKLDISDCVLIGNFDIAQLIQNNYLDSVVELRLRTSSVNDNIAESIAKNLHHLKVLDLGSTKVTGVGVKGLVINPNINLEALGLQNCTAVSSDAVDFARSKGIHVTYGFTDKLKYSKKVRLD